MIKLRKRQIVMLATLIVAGCSWLVSRYASLPYVTDGSIHIATTSTTMIEPSDSGEEIDESNSLDDDIVEPSSSSTVVDVNATVLHVVDGDTLDADLDGVGKVRIRMLGVNTPETVDPRKTVECFGKDASNFSKKTLVIGSRIRLEPDPQADERDKYGRLLRNVILADGTDYNAFLVQEGYAYAYLNFPLDPKRKTQLKKLESSAKDEKRGLWGAGCQ